MGLLESSCDPLTDVNFEIFALNPCPAMRHRLSLVGAAWTVASLRHRGTQKPGRDVFDYVLDCRRSDPTSQGRTLFEGQLISYHTRTMLAHSLLICAQKMQTSHMKCLGGIIQVPISLESWLRAKVPIKKGGFDIRDPAV